MTEKQQTQDLNVFVEKAHELGATEAKLISPQSIVTAPWVRFKCQYGCGGYSSSHCCPPSTPTPQQMREILDSYSQAILIHCRGSARPTEIVARLERMIFLSGFYKATSLGAGPCRLCKECNPGKCIQPDKARPSMEACGIDVYATARSSGFPLEVLVDKTCEKDTYGVVLID